jgi:hypothetical protein
MKFGFGGAVVKVSLAKHSTRLIALAVGFLATFAEAQVQVKSHPGFDVPAEEVIASST